jgi:SAM-dependent methyltransferase
MPNGREKSRQTACPLCLGDGRLFCLDLGRRRRYWRCSVCRLSWLDPAQRPTPEVETQQYALHRNHPDDPAYRRFLARLATPLLARLPAASSGLDYGCGPGPSLAAMLRAAGHGVRLYDPCFQPDADALSGHYDFVTCTETAEHFFAPGSEFDRLAKLLAPGGRLGLMTGLLTADHRFARWRYRHDPTHVCFYRRETMAFLAKRHGWVIEYAKGDVVIFRADLLNSAGHPLRSPA